MIAKQIKNPDPRCPVCKALDQVGYLSRTVDHRQVQNIFVEIYSCRTCGAQFEPEKDEPPADASQR